VPEGITGGTVLRIEFIHRDNTGRQFSDLVASFSRSQGDSKHESLAQSVSREEFFRIARNKEITKIVYFGWERTLEINDQTKPKGIPYLSCDIDRRQHGDWMAYSSLLQMDRFRSKPTITVALDSTCCGWSACKCVLLRRATMVANSFA